MQKNQAVRIDKVKSGRRAHAGVKALVLLVLLGVVVAGTLSAASYIMDNISHAQAQRAALETQIAEAEARRRQIEDSAAYISSIDFIERFARSRLNLVRRDEIIFIMTTE